MSISKKRISVIGSGSWATAIVKILHDTQEEVGWYVREKKIIEYILEHKHNPSYTSSVSFDVSKLKLSNNINDVVENSDILIFVIPSTYLKSWLSPLTVSLNNKLVVSAIKGIVPQDDCTIAEFFNKNYNVPFDRIGVISGPSHAEEVALERLSYLTFTCKTADNATELATFFDTHYIKTNISTDIYGVEYAAVLKNIYAIATGIAHGLNYGDNFLSVLVCNSQYEIEKFLNKTYPDKRKQSTSPYLGDLLVTTYSQFSRNRTFGTMIGKGYSVKSALLEMNMVAEGYNASKCIREINRNFNVDMPIAEAVYNILYENISPAIEMKLLTSKLQ
ncbi:MAG: NAD(P)-binding domain-containing protein [Bacteroidales bacterium]|nr:NAD(P)-binding domain-containing protein [Bacteroidales bacterium]HPD94252.1 NAD(P)-binding domain-containing protein [Tenuifilaceae bacterium]HRX30300.1 NAD(P)-binding domain-containing protein [Tenuifilaceae bacterium]